MQRIQIDYKGYDRPDMVLRYRRATAGRGINYVLPSTYGPILLDAARAALPAAGSAGLRIVEFGCGAGMAAHYLADALGERGIDVDLVVGADFVPAMIEAANADLDEYGSDWAKQRIRYVVASNETLGAEIADGLRVPVETLTESFHIAIGINTFRYSIREGMSATVVNELDKLLSSGGRVVIIDMNDRFPYGLKPRKVAEQNGRLSPIRFGRAHIPTLEDYAAPWSDAGFEILRRGKFCWIPHSANGLRFQLSRLATPVLEKVASERAMRSLIVAAKP